MDVSNNVDFVGRHVLLDVLTYSSKNLNNIECIYEFLETLSIELNMTLIHPPIVARIPFASNELARYTNLLKQDGVDSQVVDDMSQFLKLRETKMCGISAVTMWLESHSSIHTWPETNFFSFDAYSCKNFNPEIVYNLLRSVFDIKLLNGADINRFTNRLPEVTHINIHY
jgi:S-adenosylmethionine decarboxylase